MELQVSKREHLRHTLPFHFNSGISAAEATREINDVYSPDFIAERTSRKWFARFNEEFCLDVAPRAGRPSDFDEKQLDALLRDDCR